ncbi:G patch domain-containing protein 11-like [Panulirus ornatus]|uniref:G patch domain-containing protein 11-like n=1 Tax=Panulirus ornatus TaxID=150431 RepID=UPI003A85F5D8
MSDSENEIDYMSEEFLAACVGKDDVRPGLLLSHSSKHQVQMEKRKKEKDNEHRARFKPAKVVQKERLEEGLSTAINSSNKGFSMLQKMGYKPGTSLGKQSQGRLEPVPVEMKSDRVGLGWQQMIAEHRRKRELRKQQKRDKHSVETDPEKFRARMRSQRQEKFLHHDLMKSQRVCYEMDSKQNLTEPIESWFWPSFEEEEWCEEEEEEECDVEYEPEEQLNILTDYLRSTYMYCIWCCTVYDDERDLKQNCPGPTRADHDDD